MSASSRAAVAGIAAAVAHDGEGPGQIDQAGERLDQQVVALARHHGADREQRDGCRIVPPAYRRPVRAGRRNRDALRRHAIVGRQRARGRRGWSATTARDRRARRALAVAQQDLRPVRAATGLQRQRMVHQRDQRMGVARLAAASGITPKASPSITIGRPFGTSGKASRRRPPASARSGAGKPSPRLRHFGPPAERAQFRDHAPVIDIAAGRRIEVARDREDEVAFHHKGASYQARAFGDSPTVTRSAGISRGSRPSLPAFTRLGEAVEHPAGQEFGGGVTALELRASRRGSCS